MTDESVPENVVTEETPSTPSRFSRLWAKRDNFSAWLASRRFGKIVTPFIFLCTLVLLGLGTWQMQRLQWKNTLLTVAEQDFAKPAADLRLNPPHAAADWQALHYKPVILKGQWLTPFHAIKMGPRTYEGQAGYQLIIPLQLEDHQVVLVNRGFAPDKMGILPPEKSAATIYGVAYLPETTKPRYLPENIPSRGVWVWPDMVAMGHEIGRDNVAPVMVFENRIEGKDDYPIGGQLPLPGTNSHRQYAVTWYALAIALIGVWLMASNPKPEASESTLGTDNKEKQVTDPVAQRGMYPEATD